MGKKKYVRTTAIPLKVSIKCEPVAWAGEKILKYRAAVVVTDTRKRSRQIGGDPAENVYKAVENLRKELATFLSSINAAVPHTNSVLEYMFMNKLKSLPSDEEIEKYKEICSKMEEEENGRKKEAGDSADKGA